MAEISGDFGRYVTATRDGVSELFAPITTSAGSAEEHRCCDRGTGFYLFWRGHQPISRWCLRCEHQCHGKERS